MVTGMMGQIMPISCVAVLPGDTFQGNSSVLVRVSPLNTPVMHPVSVRVHHFFVPNRIIFPDWEDFITGGPDGTSAPAIPTGVTGTDKRGLQTYLGLPAVAGMDYNLLPVYAANAVFNEYYRDQDLVTERAEDDRGRMYCAWEKDYFSTARPWSQKGPSVSLPIGDRADVRHGGTGSGNQVTVLDQADDWRQLAGTPTVTTGPLDLDTADQLYADLSSATSPDINDWRAAFSIQRYQEARARYGSRFTEYLRYLGVTPSDARLQRPEFLGGGTTRLNFSEVLQTGPTDTSSGGVPGGIGDLWGHGIAGVRSNRYRKFFEEHGYCLTFLSVRPKALYVNGTPREFLKTTKEDYYQKELVNLGQQEVYQAELYPENTRDVFGFQDRYHEYRSQPSQVSQDFRDTLNAWHLGRELAPDPVLNASFVECKPSTRIFQITDPDTDNLWIMANNHIVARRLVPSRANPRIL